MLTEFYSRAMCFNMAPEIRIELILAESKSAVLPIHHSGTFGTQIFKEQ